MYGEIISAYKMLLGVGYMEDLNVVSLETIIKMSLNSVKYEGYVIIMQSVLRHVHSLFQIEFSREYNLVLPLSISNVFSCP